MQIASGLENVYINLPTISFNREIEWNFIEKQVIIQAINTYFTCNPNFSKYMYENRYSRVYVIKPCHSDDGIDNRSYHFNIQCASEYEKSPTIHAYLDYKKFIITKMTIIQEI